MNLLTNTFDKLKITYDESTIYKFKKYMENILEWNNKVNLTSITDENEFIKKHYVDSILCCESRQFLCAKKIIDVGTGAGFPGIPLAIICPEKEFYLIDSLNKRIKIIESIAKDLNINNVRFYHGRAEDLAHSKEHREKYDLCVSRAVANLSVLSEYCLPFVKLGGWFAAYKSSGAEEEIKNSLKAIELLGGKMESYETFNLDGFDLDHKIIFIEKVKKTMTKYPRKAGTPAKEPLK